MIWVDKRGEAALPLQVMFAKRFVQIVTRDLSLVEREVWPAAQIREREGSCDVPRPHEEQGVKLGMWLNTQRTAQKKGLLIDGRRRRLEEAGVTWDPTDAQWERAFELLMAFRELEGSSGHSDGRHVTRRTA